jgi:hypothetical protein
MEFKKNDKMFAQWLDKHLSTGYSEKHWAVWNALHYGMTSGKSKRWYQQICHVRSSAFWQLVQTFCILPVVMKPISTSVNSWASRIWGSELLKIHTVKESDYGLDDGAIGVWSPAETKGFFPLSSVSRPPLGPTQPPVRWVPWGPFPGPKARSGSDDDHSHHPVPMWISMSYICSPPRRLHGV